MSSSSFLPPPPIGRRFYFGSSLPPSDPVGRRFYFCSPLRLSTTKLHDSRNNEPLFHVSIFLRQKYKITWKDSISGELFREDESLSGPNSHKSCVVPPQLVCLPDSCTGFMFDVVSNMLNYDDVSLCHDIASKFGSFVSDSVKQHAGCQTFYVTAHVVIVEDFVADVDMSRMIMPLFDFDDEDHVVVSRGASMSVLKKLKKERFSMKELQDDGETCNSCVVCLEKFSTTIELIRFPCKHIFHEQCIFDWLKKSTSCPVCRYELE